ncbi:MAG: hypothetical protein KAV18_03795 [Candidatus Omnitrophica bacterium]|nr:hypothetical protein [Candidatus Omnitrophota bacterium]
MVPVEALELALSKEKEAIKMYKKFSVEHPIVSETFLFLMDEEYKHQKMLEEKIYELTK